MWHWTGGAAAGQLFTAQEAPGMRWPSLTFERGATDYSRAAGNGGVARSCRRGADRADVCYEGKLKLRRVVTRCVGAGSRQWCSGANAVPRRGIRQRQGAARHGSHRCL
jgi:hypothetical protein